MNKSSVIFPFFLISQCDELQLRNMMMPYVCYRMIYNLKPKEYILPCTRVQILFGPIKEVGPDLHFIVFYSYCSEHLSGGGCMHFAVGENRPIKRMPK